MSTSIPPSPVPASPAQASPAQAHAIGKWLKAAFAVQSILFALLISALIFVSVSYSVKQQKMAAQIAQQKADLAEQQTQNIQEMHNLATEQMNYALDLMNDKRYADAALQIDGALLDWPGEPVAWRQKALIFLQTNRGQEALQDFLNPASGVALNDPTNLITEAILYCGLKQPARADQLVAGLPASFAAAPDDKRNFKAVCGHDLAH
jgi:hypothetical protein